MRRGTARPQYKGDTPGAASAFSPTDIANLALWLDASDASTVTLDGSNNVSQWNDKSGNGRNVSNGVTTQRPSYATASWNGLNAVIFDGTDDRLSSSAFTLGTYTMIAVVSRNWTVNAFRGWFGHDYGSTTGRGVITTGSAGSEWLAGELAFFGNGFSAGQNPRAIGSKPTVSDNVPVCVSARLGNSSILRVNGAANLRTSGNGTVTSSNSAMFIGYTGVSPDFWNGRVCEIVLYDRELSDAEIVSVENYLRTKWGTS